MYCWSYSFNLCFLDDNEAEYFSLCLWATWISSTLRNLHTPSLLYFSPYFFSPFGILLYPVCLLFIEQELREDRNFVLCPAVSPVLRTMPEISQLPSDCVLNKWCMKEGKAVGEWARRNGVMQDICYWSKIELKSNVKFIETTKKLLWDIRQKPGKERNKNNSEI